MAKSACEQLQWKYRGRRYMSQPCKLFPKDAMLHGCHYSVAIAVSNSYFHLFRPLQLGHALSFQVSRITSTHFLCVSNTVSNAIYTPSPLTVIFWMTLWTHSDSSNQGSTVIFLPYDHNIHILPVPFNSYHKYHWSLPFLQSQFNLRCSHALYRGRFTIKTEITKQEAMYSMILLSLDHLNHVLICRWNIISILWCGFNDIWPKEDDTTQRIELFMRAVDVWYKEKIGTRAHDNTDSLVAPIRKWCWLRLSFYTGDVITKKVKIQTRPICLISF